MTPAIERLVAILAPPDAPLICEVGREDVLRNIGVALPDDDFEFIERYGAGAIEDFFFVFLPSSENSAYDLTSQLKHMARSFEALRNSGNSRLIACHAFPSPGGLIPWGKTIDGDVAFWRTGDPDPNRWPVVLLDSDKENVVKFDGPMSEFLEAVLSRRLRTSIFPDDFPPVNPKFIVEEIDE